MRVGHQVGDPLVVLVVDDRGVVGVVDNARVELRNRGLRGLHEVLNSVALDQHVVGGDAGLPGIEQLAADDALCSRRVVVLGMHDRGRLAAELERDRREVRRCGLHDEPADGRGAGEQNVVEGQGAERLGDVGATDRHRHAIGPQRLVQALLEERRGSGRRLRRLDDHPVAGSDGCGQRTDGEQQGIVPGRDDEHDALGLPVDAAGSRPEQNGSRAPLGPHPAMHIDHRIAHEAQRRHHLGHACLVVRAPAEVLRNRLAELLRARIDSVAQTPQQSLALRGSERRVAAARLVHEPEAPADILQPLVRCGSGKSGLAHDYRPELRLRGNIHPHPRVSVQHCARRPCLGRKSYPRADVPARMAEFRCYRQ